MHRSHFIHLIIASAVAGAAGGATSGSDAPRNLSRWASRYQAALTHNGEGLVLKARLRKTELQTALQELSHLADRSLHCAANEVTGSIAGEVFRLDLSVA